MEGRYEGCTKDERAVWGTEGRKCGMREGWYDEQTFEGP
jgi:hypothetical protein